jgi:hypothetical protein
MKCPVKNDTLELRVERNIQVFGIILNPIYTDINFSLYGRTGFGKIKRDYIRIIIVLKIIPVYL